MSILVTVNDAVEKLIQKVGRQIVVATPLGAGKPNHILNALYTRAKNDSTINLKILTALTLQKPVGKSDLEKRFLQPLADRVFGDYPNLLFEEDRLRGRLPENIEVVEFYFRAGQFVNHVYGQKNYLSSNYTHVARDCFDRGVNVICQQVCKGEIDGESVYSLSCNSDTSRDLVDLLKASEREFVTVAQVNQDLPFMYGESVVGDDYFQIVVDDRELDFPVFAPPKTPVASADYMIGMHSSTLIEDDGEIQIGIGSLADALVYGLCLRQEENHQYKTILRDLGITQQYFPVISTSGSSDIFSKGLFAATEMLVDSFSELYRKKILKKKVYDSPVIQKLLNEGEISEEFSSDIFAKLYGQKAIRHILSQEDVLFLKEFGILRQDIRLENGKLVNASGESFSANIFETDLDKISGTHLRNGAVAHSGFFLGPRSFYNFLKELPVAERKLFRMKRISQVNQLYGNEELDRLQRINGRFINTCMKVTLNGSACSDALEDGNQISGVGGQYNFVAMAHEMPGARSILQLRSTRFFSNGRLESNIVFNYGNCTIPRHLRDIVVTEYGIADLRGKTDEEVAIELIQIADSRFQPQLIVQAQRANKLSENFKLPSRFAYNRPERYAPILEKNKRAEYFPSFPFGTDLTENEIRLAGVLKKLKVLSKSKKKFVLFILSSLFLPKAKKELEPFFLRMNLAVPKNLKERFYKRLIHKALIAF